MKLTVRPADGLVDEPVAWQVEGVAPGTAVRLEVEASDEAGRRWRSVGSYPVGADGMLEVDDPDRPWWSMELLDASPPTTFTAPVAGWTATARAFVGGVTAEASVDRVYAHDLETDARAGTGWVMNLYLPRHEDAPGPGVLLLGGSSGMASVAPRAALLASRGYRAAVLGYMQEPGLPPGMDRIPVEVVASALAAFTEADRVAVWSISVGTGLALSALAQPDAPPVAAVIATAPTDVVWQALAADGAPPKRGSLSRDGQELPWLPMRSELVLAQVLRNALLRMLPGRRRSTALILHDVYARGRRDVAAVARCAIPVERIAAPLLLIAGEADVMWPAAEMATRVYDRRQQAGVGDHDQLLVLPGVGHFIGPPAAPTTADRNLDLVSGGNPRGTGVGHRRAWTAALRFLDATVGGSHEEHA